VAKECICRHPQAVHSGGAGKCSGKSGVDAKKKVAIPCSCTSFELLGLCDCGHQLNHHPKAGAWHDEDNKPTRACSMTVPGTDPITGEPAEVPCPCTTLTPVTS